MSNYLYVSAVKCYTVLLNKLEAPFNPIPPFGTHEKYTLRNVYLPTE